MKHPQKIGQWLVYWEVIGINDAENEYTAARFIDPQKAANYCVTNQHGHVQILLAKPEWGIKTND